MQKTETRPKALKREIELDFVRGIAILLVLDYHTKEQILSYPFKLLGYRSLGWAGVDVFFILSGFLVGGLLIKEWKVQGRIDAGRFLIRRGFKIWPQYYFYLCVVLLTGHRAILSLWGNFLNIQNYTGGIAHTWSLAVEEHAYILLTLLLVFASRQRVRMRNLFLFLGAVVCAVIVVRLVEAVHGYQTYSPTHSRIDGILEGVMLAILYHYATDVFHRAQDMWWVWVAALLGALGFLRLNLAGGAAASLGIDAGNLIGIALLMLLYRHREGQTRPALYRLVAWFGVYSYGIYLWLVSAGVPIFTIAAHLPERLRPVFIAVFQPMFAIFLGVVTTRLIELPALKLRDRLFPKRVDSAVGPPAEEESGPGGSVAEAPSM